MKIKTYTGTWLGRRAECKELRQSGAAGVREIRTRWIDDAHENNGGYPAGTITSTTISGDFTRGTGKVINPVHVVSEF